MPPFFRIPALGTQRVAAAKGPDAGPAVKAKRKQTWRETFLTILARKARAASSDVTPAHRVDPAVTVDPAKSSLTATPDVTRPREVPRQPSPDRPRPAEGSKRPEIPSDAVAVGRVVPAPASPTPAPPIATRATGRPGERLPDTSRSAEPRAVEPSITARAVSRALTDSPSALSAPERPAGHRVEASRPLLPPTIELAAAAPVRARPDPRAPKPPGSTARSPEPRADAPRPAESRAEVAQPEVRKPPGSTARSPEARADAPRPAGPRAEVAQPAVRKPPGSTARSPESRAEAPRPAGPRAEVAQPARRGVVPPEIAPAEARTGPAPPQARWAAHPVNRRANAPRPAEPRDDPAPPAERRAIVRPATAGAELRPETRASGGQRPSEHPHRIVAEAPRMPEPRGQAQAVVRAVAPPEATHSAHPEMREERTHAPSGLSPEWASAPEPADATEGPRELAPPAASHAQPGRAPHIDAGTRSPRMAARVPAKAVLAAAPKRPLWAAPIESHGAARAAAARDLTAPGEPSKPSVATGPKSVPSSSEARRAEPSEGGPAGDTGPRAAADDPRTKGADVTLVEPRPVAPAPSAMTVAPPTPQSPSQAPSDAASAPWTPEAVAQAIVARARVLPENGAVEVRFAMQPVELGPVRVRIETRGRELRIEMSASSPAAASALAEGLPRLTADLRDAGYRLPDIALTVDLSHDGREAHAQGGDEPAHPCTQRRHHDRTHARLPVLAPSAPGALDLTI